MTRWPPITRDDLKEAAGRAGFDTTFPLLVRRLIAETADGLTELDIPGGSGVAAGGFDGVVTATGSTPEVPAGTSVWELSITDKSGKKANDDYAKRTTGPDGGSTRQITYVQVILSAWTKGRSWAVQRSKERRWRQVRAHNLDDIHGWLDRAPATTAWLADQLGKAMPGVRLADDWLSQTWLSSTRIPLGDEYVLAGRDAPATALLAALAAGLTAVTVSGDLTADEFRAFVAASLARANSPSRDMLQARALLVNDPSSLGQLMAQQQPLVLVLADPRLAAQLPGKHRHQLVLLVPPGSPAIVNVGRVDAQAVRGLLQATGEPWEQAARLGALARRSLSGLRRALAGNPAFLTPSWVDGADALRRRLLLLGSWDGSSVADRDVVQDVTGRPYTDVEDAALALAAADDTPMLGRLDEHWHLLAAEDAWMLLRARLTRGDLDACSAAATKVLSDPDPFFGMDMTGRLMAQMAGTHRRYSGALRQGLARTLALLGSTESPLPATSRTTGADLARQPVREILATANADRTYGLWTALRDVLGMLAEASPEEFLAAMRDGLQGPDPLHARMYTDARHQDGLFEGSPTHTAFLWALEILAWSPEHFDDVVDVLARLAALDPGGRYSNRPSRSLADIFSCWHPTTAANDDQRFEALQRLLRSQPDIARRLLVDLIPDGRDIQMSNLGPRFRDWKRERALTREDVKRNAAAVVTLLLDDLQDCPERYLALIKKIDHLSPDHRQRFAHAVTTLGSALGDDSERAALHDALREKTAHHREYADTVWALPDRELQVLERAAASVAPRTARLKVAWLFASAWIELGDQSRRDDLQAYDNALRARRAEAVGRVLAEDGLDGVAQLAADTEFPHLVGVGLAAHTDAFDEQMLIWLDQDGAPQAVAYAYLARRLQSEGEVLLDALLDAAASAEAKAVVLRATHQPQMAWSKLPRLTEAVAEAYWQGFIYYGLGDFDGVLQAARGLLSARRHAAALGILSLYSAKARTQEAAEIAAIACEGLLAADPGDTELRQLSSHDFQQIMRLLDRHRDTIGVQRVINIEWQFFPALGFEPNSPALHSALSTDPTFFAEIVGYLYRREDEVDEAEAHLADDMQTQARREVPSRAFHVLRSWRSCPGTGPDGTIDSDTLRDWVSVARECLHDQRQSGAGDSEIGQILAHASPDSDGMFPPSAVRDLLEEVASDRIDEGLRLGIVNKRGVVTRGVHDGGDQERDLSETYREAAEKSGAWPRTRRILRHLAEEYEREARYNDEDAERRRRGLGD